MLSVVVTALMIAAILGATYFINRDQHNAALPQVQATPVATPDQHAWPMFGGNPARDRNMPGPGPAGQPTLRWTSRPAGSTNLNGALDRGAVAGGVVYLAPFAGGDLVAVDAATGKEVWQAKGYGNTVVVDGDGLIVHGNAANGDAVDLARIRRSDGGLVWTAEQGKIHSAWNPVVADGVGYIPSGSDFIAFDPLTGKTLWRTALAAPASRGASVAKGIAVLGDQNGTIYGISTADGKIVWTLKTDATTIGHPSLANGMVYFTGIGGVKETYYAIDASTGALKWRYVSPDGTSFLSAAVDRTTVYAPTHGKGLYALDAATGALKWTFKATIAVNIAPALVGDTLYVGTADGLAYALDAATGAERWRFQLDAGDASSALVVDGVLYLSTTTGTLYAIGGTGSNATPAAQQAAPAGTPVAAQSGSTGEPVRFVWASSGDPQHPLTRPGALAFDPAGRLWVTSSPGTILILDLDGNVVETWGAPGSGDGQFNFSDNNGSDAGNLVFAPDGGFYVADFYNFRIQQFDRNRKFVRAWGGHGSADGQFLAPLGLAIDGSGNLLVADFLRNDIQRFTLDGVFISKFGGPGTGPGQFNQASLITVAPSGDLWIADIANNRIQVFGQDGSFKVAFGQGLLNGPSQAAFDANGNAFVTDQNNNRIQVFDGQGHALYQFGTLGAGDGQFSNPQSIAINRGGNIYVLDWKNNRLEKFKIAGPFPTPTASPAAEATPQR